jgi:hypothetical protein
MSRKASRTRKATKRTVKKSLRAKLKLPRAFRITPIKAKFPRPKHAHLLGEPGLPPCPGTSTFMGYANMQNKRYCVYLDGAQLIFIECPP